jgi:DNA-binding NtrC family response regulator
MATAQILVVDDEPLMREFVQEVLSRAGHDITAVASGREAATAQAIKAFDLVVTDLKMTPMDGLELLRHCKRENPRGHVIVMTAYGTIESAVAALKEGADDYLLKPFSPDELELAVDRALARGRLAEENRYLRAEANQPFDFQAMIGASARMREVYSQIEKVADSRATVLIRGESGTGKELVARALHYTGGRRDNPFIKVNCAALSAGLLESELFGHEKGSFTGAHERKIGRFELADTGTLLLDEISEIGADLQPKLLRALQEREIERVGGSGPIKVDVRIIATSNRNLEQAVGAHQFREDLFFRLNVIPIHLPPLRARKEDIPALMDHFLKRFNQENGRSVEGFSAASRAMFEEYPWPGNIRELQNTIERAVVLAAEPLLEPKHFSLDWHMRAGHTFDVGVNVGTTVADMERALIFKTLETCRDNRTQAAKLLGISVRTLRNKLKEYGKNGQGVEG